MLYLLKISSFAFVQHNMEQYNNIDKEYGTIPQGLANSLLFAWQVMDNMDIINIFLFWDVSVFIILICVHAQCLFSLKKMR